MQDMQTKVMERYFFFGLLFATLVFTFFIFRPFWIVLVLGLAFSIVLFPLYEWFRRHKFPSTLASLSTVISFAVLLCGPVLGIGFLVFNQSQDVYRFVLEENNANPFLDQLDTAINAFLPDDFDFSVHDKVSGFVSYLSGNIARIFSATISAFFSFILMLLIMFYFLKDGMRWRKAIIVLSPLGDADDERIISRLSLAIKSVILGSLLIALVQGLLMGVGLWIFGVPNPALWGVVAAVFSLLPTIGTAVVSVPAIIFLFVTGSTGGALGLLIWAVVAVGLVDNALSPYFISGRTHIPPLLILFSVLGGISALGPVGVLVGPLTVSLLYTLISIYRNEFRQNSAF